MEHRYGIRYRSAIDVFVRSHCGRFAAKGRLIDVSISGAFVSTSLSIAPLSSITIEVSPVITSKGRFKPIEAQVIRRTDSGLGVEWKDLTPASLSQLIEREQPTPTFVETPARIRG
jgi:PilZ domain